MPSTIPSRPLHRATCIEDLIRESEVKLEKQNPKLVCKTLGKLLEEAKKSRMNGDDENTYILYMRYLSCIRWLKKTPEVIKNKDFLKPYVSGSKVKEILDLLEEMQKTLVHRYQEKKLQENSKLLMDKAMRIDVDPENSNLDDLLDDIGDVKLHLPDTPTDDPVEREPETMITCMETFQAVNKLNDRIIIIDIRESDDFKKSHINSNQCVNVAGNLIKSGKLARDIFKSITCDGRTERILSHRDSRYTDLIVLLDWQTTEASLNPANRLNIFKTLLWDWDPGVSYKKILILDGGYKEWLTRYPTLTTNPNVAAPDLQSNNIAEILEEVEYPDSIPSDEDQPMFLAKIKPIPERSLKPMTKEKKELGLKKFNGSNDRKPNGSKSTSDTNYDSIYPNISSSWRMDTDNNSLSKPLGPKKKVTEKSNVNDSKMSNDSKKRNVATKPKAVEISKPTIDRSSKPNTVKIYNPDSEKILSLLKQAADVLKICLQLENDRMMLESQMFGSEDEKDEVSEQMVETIKRVEIFGVIIAEKMKFYMDIKSQLDEYKARGINVDPAYEEEANRLRLDISMAEHGMRSVSNKRKVFMNNRHKKLEENAEIKRKNLSTPPHESDKEIVKAPLKKDGPSTTSGLKRSYSSPNLKQLEPRKEFGNRGFDNNIPQVDRTSKPSKQQEENIGNFPTNNNSTTINVQRLKQDRERRMCPVFGSPHPGITGLKNLGNSCYMNSIIQCLSNTTSLARYFIQGSYTHDLNTKTRKTEGQVVEEVAQVIKALWCGHYRSISPLDLKVVIGQYKKQFKNEEQQDSHEFLTFLLDWMHNDLKTKAKIDLERTIGNAEKEWDKAMGGHTSIISQLFFGQLRSTISCSTCGDSSTTYESFNSLTLSLPDSVRCTLDDCIKKYVSGQRVSGWRCPSCKAARDATKKFDFIKLAPIIVVHLNRFGETGGWIQKANTAVDFPLLSLDLRSYVVHESDTTTTINNSYHQTYNLYAVSNHYGTMDGGHYTAYCNSASQNKWYKYDDSQVREAPASEVKSQNASAYLLFYTSVPNSPYMVM